MRALMTILLAAPAVLLAGCAPTSIMTRGPFMEASWVPGDTRSASAGETLLWWQYGMRDSVITTRPGGMWSNSTNEADVVTSVSRCTRIELGFNGFRDGHLVIRTHEFQQTGEAQTPGQVVYSGDRSENLLYFDLLRDSTLTILGVPLQVVSASQSNLTCIAKGLPPNVAPKHP